MEFSATKIGLLVIGCLLIFNFFAWQTVLYLSDPFSSVIFFNVGQGDAILIQTPQKHQILIDGGPNSDILRGLSSELPFYDKTLDLAILTHPEKDHLTGLLEVLKRYKVKNILWTGVVRNTKEWRELQELIEKEGANVYIAKKGERIIVQDPDIFIDILNPQEYLQDVELEDSNFSSIVARLSIGNRSFLFTGDIDTKTEMFLTGDADVLKVAHHGSKYSSSEEFLKNVLPGLAVIQVGENNYGHPTEDLLARLDKFGIEVLRTDKDGDVKIICDGKNLKLINN